MPVFHQIEGLVIDRDINLGHLAGTIEAFTKAFFGEGFTSRLRPSYFPFTEPSGEFDIRTPSGEWLELGGCGMVHPNVLRYGGIDPERVERIRVRLRHRPHGQGTPRRRGPPRDVHRRHPLLGAVLMKVGADMKIALSWLADYLGGGSLDTDTVIEACASLGLPVEDVIHTGGVAGVITARVVRTERHPDAAKVIRVWVDAGDGVERHVWCGASNFAAGDVVPLATLGTAMPDGRVIGSRGILGIDSEGMLCSARELGLGTDHSGILVLPRRRAARRAVRRRHRARHRRRARPRRDPQPARRQRVPRRRPRPRAQARAARSRHPCRRSPCPATPVRPRSTSSTATAVDGSRSRCCRASSSVRARRGWPPGCVPSGSARSATSST